MTNCGRGVTFPVSVLTYARRLDGTPAFVRPIADVIHELLGRQRARQAAEARELAELIAAARARHPTAVATGVRDTPSLEWRGDRARITLVTRALDEAHDNPAARPRRSRVTCSPRSSVMN